MQFRRCGGECEGAARETSDGGGEKRLVRYLHADEDLGKRNSIRSPRPAEPLESGLIWSGLASPVQSSPVQSSTVHCALCTVQSFYLYSIALQTEHSLFDCALRRMENWRIGELDIETGDDYDVGAHTEADATRRVAIAMPQSKLEAKRSGRATNSGSGSGANENRGGAVRATPPHKLIGARHADTQRNTAPTP
ncbi:hypothetical protein V9T40_007424 [Parthenolecanium corni]|uniref:Uncharacterized protein n=1 Tax=Parthenolecanium corni TaxID=536013 RepID=A0AAN9TYC8_9HEMI